MNELQYPRERCIVVPARKGSIFASIAETVWVLAGRNDLDFLRIYVPSAGDYSDDGRTWRAGYGPRIRNWHGVDQLNRVADLLEHDRSSRRAVMSIFDPAEDFVDSKDIPCNNWIHSYVRGDALAMNVAIRSNDIWFGFSGINAFEWSVVQEILASWIGVEMGPLTFFASSLHLYAGRHGDRPERVVRHNPGVTCYEMGLGTSRFETPREQFDNMLRSFLSLEITLRTNPALAERDIATFGDPLLRDFLRALWIYHGHKLWSAETLRDRLLSLPDNDITFAIYDYFAERDCPIVPDARAHPKIHAFWPIARGERERVPATEILGAIGALHREKSNVYGDSWKRRGEVLGVLANLARKVDRLEGLTRAARIETLDETPLDTAVDLFVYALKYQTFLADEFSELAAEAAFSVSPPWSDGVAGFDELLGRVPTEIFAAPSDVSVAAMAAIEAFKQLEAAFATDALAPPLERFHRGQCLADAAVGLVAAICDAAPAAALAFMAVGRQR